MLGKGKTEKIFQCTGCGINFSNLSAERVCSNCFACTGCEIYSCPSCGTENEIKPKKPMNRKGN